MSWLTGSGYVPSVPSDISNGSLGMSYAGGLYGSSNGIMNEVSMLVGRNTAQNTSSWTSGTGIPRTAGMFVNRDINEGDEAFSTTTTTILPQPLTNGWDTVWSQTFGELVNVLTYHDLDRVDVGKTCRVLNVPQINHLLHQTSRFGAGPARVRTSESLGKKLYDDIRGDEVPLFAYFRAMGASIRGLLSNFRDNQMSGFDNRDGKMEFDTVGTYEDGACMSVATAGDAMVRDYWSCYQNQLQLSTPLYFVLALIKESEAERFSSLFKEALLPKEKATLSARIDEADNSNDPNYRRIVWIPAWRKMSHDLGDGSSSNLLYLDTHPEFEEFIESFLAAQFVGYLVQMPSSASNHEAAVKCAFDQSYMNGDAVQMCKLNVMISNTNGFVPKEVLRGNGTRPVPRLEAVPVESRILQQLFQTFPAETPMEMDGDYRKMRDNLSDFLKLRDASVLDVFYAKVEGTQGAFVDSLHGVFREFLFSEKVKEYVKAFENTKKKLPDDLRVQLGNLILKMIKDVVRSRIVSTLNNDELETVLTKFEAELDDQMTKNRRRVFPIPFVLDSYIQMHSDSMLLESQGFMSPLRFEADFPLLHSNVPGVFTESSAAKAEKTKPLIDESIKSKSSAKKGSRKANSGSSGW